MIFTLFQSFFTLLKHKGFTNPTWLYRQVQSLIATLSIDTLDRPLSLPKGPYNYLFIDNLVWPLSLPKGPYTYLFIDTLTLAPEPVAGAVFLLFIDTLTLAPEPAVGACRKGLSKGPFLCP